MSKKIKISLYIYNGTDLYKEEWFKFFVKLIKPEEMKFGELTNRKYQKYDENKFFINYMEEKEYGIGNISIRSEFIDKKYENIYLLKTKNTYIYSCDLKYKNYKKHEKEIEKFIDEFFIKTKASTVYITDVSDSVMQNLDDLDMLKMFGVDIEKINKKPNSLRGEIADIEYNPGHNHRPYGLWFGSCWKMWYGHNYYQFISKDKLSDFKDCYENVELEDGSRRITLYENIDDYDKPENRERQWSFRKSVGIDEVAHELEKEEKENPRKVSEEEVIVEIRQDIETVHGGILEYREYFNEKGLSVPKKRATKVIILESDGKGTIVHKEEREVKDGKII
jgi:hypothetical protein